MHLVGLIYLKIHRLLHVSTLLMCHRQGVLTSVQAVSFEFIRNVARHNYKQTNKQTNKLQCD
jgi:hypothetical protein